MTDSMERPPKKKFPVPLVLLTVGVFFILILWIFSEGGSAGTPIGPKQETNRMIQALTTAYTSYIADNGAFPRNVDNQSFSRVLFGENPKKAAYMAFKPRYTNSKGELVDGWGTPFRISYLSASDVTITSAGPDKIFGTPDDITNQ